MSTSLIAPTYADLSAMKRHFELQHGDAEALGVLLDNTVSSSAFDSWFAGPGSASRFERLAYAPLGMLGIAMNLKAVAAIAGNSSALSIVAESPVAMAAICDRLEAFSVIAENTAAMGVVAASDSGMEVVAASRNAVSAMASNSDAMAVVSASSAAVNALMNNWNARRILWDSETASSALMQTGSVSRGLLESGYAQSITQPGSSWVQKSPYRGYVLMYRRTATSSTVYSVSYRTTQPNGLTISKSVNDTLWTNRSDRVFPLEMYASGSVATVEVLFVPMER